MTIINTAIIRAPAYQYVGGEGVPIPLQYAFLDALAATDNQLLIAAQAGKVIRLLSLFVTNPNATPTTLLLRNASAGAALWTANIPANNVVNPNLILPFQECGWVETSAGNGLYAWTGANTQLMTAIYVAYTPVG